MKRASIKLRVTLWFTTFMILLMVIVLAFLFVQGKRMARSSGQSLLMETVENSLSEIEFDDGVLEIDDDLDYNSNGIYLSVYGEDGGLLFGRKPRGFESNPEFQAGQLQNISEQEENWYLYDTSMWIEGYGSIFVRGIVASSEYNTTFQTMFHLTLIAFPFLLIIATVGGYLLTYRAFLPVRKIVNTANAISDGKDLSKRIDLGKGRDEVYLLGSTFDQMFDRLENAFEKERQFTSDASHELRTPITVIRAECEYALKNAETLEEFKESMESIDNQTKKMTALIEHLLMLARMDQNIIPLKQESIQIDEVLTYVCEEQREVASDKNIQIDKTGIESPMMFCGDETMMLRIFTNLLSNAIKYGKESGHIWVSLTKEKGQIVCRVKDDGIGIAKEQLPLIWNRFYQVDTARTMSQEGFGLGLAMVKWMVEAHNGTISVESELGRGTEFIIRF